MAKSRVPLRTLKIRLAFFNIRFLIILHLLHPFFVNILFSLLHLPRITNVPTPETIESIGCPERRSFVPKKTFPPVQKKEPDVRLKLIETNNSLGLFMGQQTVFLGQPIIESKSVKIDGTTDRGTKQLTESQRTRLKNLK